MLSFFANLFGYILNFLYKISGNFGFAIILFSIVVKIIMIPISIKQQKTMEKSKKLNDELKQIQFKYKNDEEKMNQEVMALYKREKMSPFSGCLSAIVQILLLFSVFYLVRSPLTYMKKIDTNVIENSISVVQENGSSSNYKEIAVINYIYKLKNQNEEIDIDKESINEEKTENSSETEESKIEDTGDNNVTEVVSEKTDENQQKQDDNQGFNIKEHIDELYINMNFFGIDLSKVPTDDLSNIKVLIIPILYVISSFISIRMSTGMNKNNNKKEKNLIGDGKEEEKEKDSYDAMMEANKSMNWFMPLMSISIACIAPLGLALYWLVNNILMIIERIILNKFFNNKKEEATKNA